MRTGRLSAVLAVALTAPLLAAAVQEQPAPEDAQARFRAEANLVRVDAYPTIDGKPVLDLAADDFEILEDDELDEEQLRSWSVRAAALPGERV